MSYYLRSENRKKGVYLQIYDRHWDKNLKQARSTHFQSVGYIQDLISEEMRDPVSFYKQYVAELNQKKKEESKEETRTRAFVASVEKNTGIFLLSSLIDELGVKETVDILASARQFQFSIFEMMEQLIFSRIISPCSKSRTVSSVFPLLWNASSISEDQVYDGCFFIGESYKKYIELFNHAYAKYYTRNYKNVYFDCTNYYFEIDLPDNDRQKGPSKENRHDPIIGQALLLDADLIPLAMQMYPGNQSEKPYIRKTIEEMKSRYKVDGRTIQVADKGLNCARNIYAAVKEAKDGYIFSKSVHGSALGNKEKEWILLENSENVFTDYRDDAGNIRFRLKSCIDDYTYKFKETDTDTGEEKETTFTVREKRVVSYTPALAIKQKAEIMKMVDKVMNGITYKQLAKEELGDASKYLIITNKDANGNKISPVYELNKSKLQEDLNLAGYNLIVTSELKKEPIEIYNIYHNLWKIEESFRITKSCLDARPVFVHKKETIYGHFLICYLSLFLLRVLEIKCFKSTVSTYDIIEFIRDFRVVDRGDNTYINISHNQKVNEKIRIATGLTNLDALILTKDEIQKLFNSTILIES